MQDLQHSLAYSSFELCSEIWILISRVNAVLKEPSTLRDVILQWKNGTNEIRFSCWEMFEGYLFRLFVRRDTRNYSLQRRKERKSRKRVTCRRDRSRGEFAESEDRGTKDRNFDVHDLWNKLGKPSHGDRIESKRMEIFSIMRVPRFVARSLPTNFPPLETAPNPTRRTSRVRGISFWACLSYSFECKVSSKRKRGLFQKGRKEKEKKYAYLAEQFEENPGRKSDVPRTFIILDLYCFAVVFFSLSSRGFIELPGVTRYLNIYIQIETSGMPGFKAHPACPFAGSYSRRDFISFPLYTRRFTDEIGPATIRSSFSASAGNREIVKSLEIPPPFEKFFTIRAIGRR